MHGHIFSTGRASHTGVVSSVPSISLALPGFLPQQERDVRTRAAMLGLVAAPPAAAAPSSRTRCSATRPPAERTGRAASLLAIPAAASLSLVLWSSPVNAGILSGSTGLESVPGPELPRVEFLEKWNAENKKKYAEFDNRFKNSKVLQELLERSKKNKEKNERQIQDKYCLRGAEWGVGDCSTEGMTDQEREDFISELRKRTGAE